MDMGQLILLQNVLPLLPIPLISQIGVTNFAGPIVLGELIIFYLFAIGLLLVRKFSHMIPDDLMKAHQMVRGVLDSLYKIKMSRIGFWDEMERRKLKGDEFKFLVDELRSQTIRNKFFTHRFKYLQILWWGARVNQNQAVFYLEVEKLEQVVPKQGGKGKWRKGMSENGRLQLGSAFSNRRIIIECIRFRFLLQLIAIPHQFLKVAMNMKDKEESREGFLQLAKFCKRVQRYEDMLRFVKKCIEVGIQSQDQEKKLFNFGYKHLIQIKKQALQKIDVALKLKTYINRQELLLKQKKIIEKEIIMLCTQAIDFIEGIQKSYKQQKEETQVFYYKLKGDCYREIIKTSFELDRETIIKKAEDSYQKAFNRLQNLNPLNIYKLGTILNYSVFLFEYKNNIERSLQISKQAYNEGVDQLQKYNEKKKQIQKMGECVISLKNLESNIKVWEEYQQEKQIKND